MALPPPGPAGAPGPALPLQARPRSRRWWIAGALAAVVVLLTGTIALVAGGDEQGATEYTARRPGSPVPETSPRSTTTTPPSPTAATPTVAPVPITAPPTSADPPDPAAGGTVVIGMDFDGDCLDWIDVCAGVAWSYWAVGVQTMPRAFDPLRGEQGWSWTPSILLAGEPDVVTEPQQVVTYHIDPAAVWSDGEPITSSDFRYTWEQIATGTDIYDPTGYVDIAAVDDSDPATAVVTFARPYPAWRELFGGMYGILPSHLLAGTDRHAAMADGYDFSGGPWILESWVPGTGMTLVPNTNYWGTVPSLDRVEFRVMPDDAAIEAYGAGELDMVYPAPAPDAVARTAAGLPGNLQASADTNALEALWLNNGAFPFDSVAVRQALAFALDRPALASELFGAVGITSPWDTISAPVSAAFADTAAFAGYRRDLARVDELMIVDGWAKNADGIWERDGRTASFTITTTVGNERRAIVQERLQADARAAGFDVALQQVGAADLFGADLPSGDYQAAIYAQVSSGTDPGLCWIMCSSNIPDPSGAGLNWTRTNVPAADTFLETAAVTVDPAARAAANQEAERLLAADVASIPLYSLPNILVWSDRIAGPVADHPILGPFATMNEWTISG